MTPIRRLVAALSAVKGWPSSSICPLVGSSRPVMQPIAVLFPLPLGPRKPNMVPARTDSERFSAATVGPYCLTRLVRRMACIGSVSSFDDSEQFFTAVVEHGTGELQGAEVEHQGEDRQRDESPPVFGRNG